MQTILTKDTELFNPLRWPKRPYCTDALEEGLKIRSFTNALKRVYIQANPPYLKAWLMFDVDRAGAAYAWDDANLPQPSWVATNTENGHAHLVWGLSAPVLLEADAARKAPIRYLAALEAAYRAALGADPGFSGLMTKNPKNEHWRVLRGPKIGFELGELAEYVDLPKHIPKRKPEEVGLGRNVTLFEFLRKFAYARIRHYKTEVRNFIYWQAYLNNRALERNGDFLHPLDGREVWHVAKSVSRWTWHRFDIEASDARFSALQAARGQKGGLIGGSKGGKIGAQITNEKRWGDNEDKQASARLMSAAGVAHGAIAEELGVSRRTIIRWLQQQPTP